MATRKKIAELLGNSERTVENWEKEDRYIIKFIRKYLNENKEIDEFIKTGKIKKFENGNANSQKIDEFILKTAQYKIIQKSKNKIESTFKTAKEMLDNSKIEAVLPIDSFCKALKKDSVFDFESFKHGINQLVIHENLKKIILDFLEDELSQIEIELIIKNKYQIINLFSH